MAILILQFTLSHIYSIGDYMRVRRKQTESHSRSYSFQDYLRELERGETEDPEEPNRANVESALQEMMKSSDALQKVPLILYYHY